jgi:phosphoribosyl 1,2-cyclic phosphate phosphodiesterase
VSGQVVDTGRITILGCGSSGGVPRVGSGWGACDPAEPRNRRRRCSILVERLGTGGTTSVLVDTSPDLRDQLLGADVTRLDGVLYTHDHADHTHGIDDLRPLAIAMRRVVPLYMDETTSALLTTRFSYCFVSPPGSDYPPIVREFRIVEGHDVIVEGPGGPVRGRPFTVQHGQQPALGFRFGALAYTPDLNAIPGSSLGALQDLDVWIVDALRRTPHPTHFSLSDALGWIERLKPKRAIITNMHTDLDYRALRAELPSGVEPAYDGLTVDFAWPR